MDIRVLRPSDIPHVQQANITNLPENYFCKYYMYHALSWPQLSYVAIDVSRLASFPIRSLSLHTIYRILIAPKSSFVRAWHKTYRTLSLLLSLSSIQYLFLCIQTTQLTPVCFVRHDRSRVRPNPRTIRPRWSATCWRRWKRSHRMGCSTGTSRV
jgi:hypothetical protein